MDPLIVAMMIGVSLFLGAIALVAFIWGIRTGQFDDENKMMNAMHYDSEDELNDAVKLEKKKAILKKKKEYRPE